jgi:hypothetical protein
VQTLLGKGESIADRVDRLLDPQNPTAEKPSRGFFPLGVGTLISVVLLNIVASLAFTMALLNC